MLALPLASSQSAVADGAKSAAEPESGGTCCLDTSKSSKTCCARSDAVLLSRGALVDTAMVAICAPPACRRCMPVSHWAAECLACSPALQATLLCLSGRGRAKDSCVQLSSWLLRMLDSNRSAIAAEHQPHRLRGALVSRIRPSICRLKGECAVIWSHPTLLSLEYARQPSLLPASHLQACGTKPPGTQEADASWPWQQAVDYCRTSSA